MKDLKPLPKLAARMGYPQATVYARLYDLYRKQRRLQKHFHAGHYWVRMPYDDFPRMFPELSSAAVRDILGELEDGGWLRMVHYGPLSWYVTSRKPMACLPKNVVE